MTLPSLRQMLKQVLCSRSTSFELNTPTGALLLAALLVSISCCMQAAAYGCEELPLAICDKLGCLSAVSVSRSQNYS